MATHHDLQRRDFLFLHLVLELQLLDLLLDAPHQGVQVGVDGLGRRGGVQRRRVKVVERNDGRGVRTVMES